MKKIFLMMLFAAAATNLNGQEIITLETDPAPFLGTWRATSDGVTYELTIKKDIMDSSEFGGGSNDLREVVSCRLVYIKDGARIKTIDFNVTDMSQSHIYGRVYEDDNYIRLNLRIYDRQRMIGGQVVIKIFDNDPDIANWDLTRPGIHISEEPKRFDIPRYLTFRKQQEIDQTNPGGDLPPGSGVQF